MLDLINEVVDNKYRITEFVNHGTFGSVYKAEREVLGQGKAGLVAVKLLRDRLADEAILMNEVKTLQRCQHPNVISCHGAGKNHLGSKLAGRFFIAMELADESLAQRLERGPLSVDEARALTADLCAGLAHLHAGQLVHRDLKPANVLRVGSTWKLSDFGLARESGYLRTASRHPGTPAYSPPEAESDTLESSFDMWSLGCVLHECLTGRLPTSPSQPRTPVIDASIPAPFQAIITGCLLQDPKRRLTAEQCLNQADPNATPLHNLPSFAFDTCFVCEPGNDCARPLLSGRIGDMRRVPDGFTCMVYAADELEGRTLLLTETWAVELGERLFDVWPTLSKRKNGVSVSAFHLFAHGTGFVANDKSLVVLDPDWLVNVTALSNVHDCERVKLVKRYEATDISNHLVVGNVVNDLFPDIWNRNDVGEARQTEEIGVQLVPLAQSGYEDVMALRATVDKHVSRLRQWADPKPRNSTLNTETYVIAPQLGLKGRIDALWFKGDTPVVLAELKTGRQRATDELQVLSYGLMLVSRGETHRDIHTLLLHSKPDLDQVMTTVKLDAPAFRRAVALRNKVLLVDGATDAPFNERWCGTCYKQTRGTCTLLTHLSEHHDTRPEGLRKRYAANEPRVAALTADVRAFFKRHEADLLEELRAVKSQQAWLWSRTSEEREREGLALRFKSITPLEQRKNGHRYHLEAMGPDGNQSLFRIDDRVIVSGPEGPTTGRLVSAFINASPLDGLEISCDEPLPFDNGGWVNFDGDEKLVEREFAALFQ
ncbi:MAG: hypothetical protein EB084_18010, partial [Proteobacteria bacterium]|nr:hypothetical protein [Pseudomonadota bacterium]